MIRKTGRRSVERAIWAIADQAAVSAVTFLVTAALASVARPAHVGLFAVCGSIGALVLGAHGAIAQEPTVLNVARSRGRARRFFLAGNVIIGDSLAASTFVLFAIGASVAWETHRTLAVALAGTGVAVAMQAAGLLARRAAYGLSRVRDAAWGSIGQLIVVAVVVSALLLSGTLSLATAYVALGVGYLAGRTVTAWRCRFGWSYLRRENAVVTKKRLRALVVANWRYGRWLVAGSVLFWTLQSAHTVFVGVARSMDDAGSLRIAQLCVLPLVQLLAAASSLFLPAASISYHRGGVPALHAKARRFMWFATIAAVAFACATGGAAAWMRARDIAPAYPGLPASLAIMGAVPITIAMTTPWLSGLRVLGSTKRVLMADGTGALISVLLGPALARSYGAPGSSASILVAGMARIAAAAWMWRGAVTEWQQRGLSQWARRRS